MFDILNEMQYIKNILENGFSEKWITDAGIYIRYCKSQGLKKSETKKKLQEKFEKYVPGYSDSKFYKKTDEILNYYWKKDMILREITEVKVSNEILNWFYYNDELTLREKKILFTLFAWSDLQKQAGIEFYKYINLNNFMKRFKEEASVASGSNIRSKELSHLGKLGYIKLTRKNTSYNCLFLDSEPFSNINNIENKDFISIPVEENLRPFGNFIKNYIDERKLFEKTSIFSPITS